MQITSTTPLIEIETGKYPAYIGTMREAHPNVSFPPIMTEETVLEYGFAPVNQVQRPTGDVVTEGQPILTDGKYYQTYEVRSFNEAELSTRLNARKKVLHDEIHKLRDKDLEEGFTYVVDENTSFTVQVRESDRINLIGLKTVVGQMIAADIDVPRSFRSRENVTYQLTPVQINALCDQALMFFETIYGESWAYLDLIAEATTIEELPELPSTLK